MKRTVDCHHAVRKNNKSTRRQHAVSLQVLSIMISLILSTALRKEWRRGYSPTYTNGRTGGGQLGKFGQSGVNCKFSKCYICENVICLSQNFVGERLNRFVSHLYSILNIFQRRKDINTHKLSPCLSEEMHAVHKLTPPPSDPEQGTCS